MHYQKYNIKKVCLITTGHVASNPRLVKEAITLIEAGYIVHIVFSQYMDYLIAEDFKILKKNSNLSFSCVVWTKSHLFTRLFTGLIQKIAFKLVNGKVNIWTKLLLNRNYYWQYKKAIKAKADLYIAHNAGALAVAAGAALENSAKFAFDAEDFHRGEDLNLTAKNCLINLENRYIPDAFYITAASPLIAAEYHKLYNKEVITVLNVFPKHSQTFINIENQNLKLFWFSQTIGIDRGIEDIIKAIGIVKNKSVQLHLLGTYTISIKEKFCTMATDQGLDHDQLIFHTPISPDKVLDFASQFDIGMATETGIPYNRDICLTNKIFTYIQSGLAVIASNTLAQKELLKNTPGIGVIYTKNDPTQLAVFLNYYIQNNSLVLKTKQTSFNLGQTSYNWEIEKEKFLGLIK